MAKSSNGCVRRLRQSSNQFRERFGRTSLGQEGEPGRLSPRVYAEPLQRRNIAERYSILFFANQGKEKIVQLKNGAGKIERVALP